MSSKLLAVLIISYLLFPAFLSGNATTTSLFQAKEVSDIIIVQGNTLVGHSGVLGPIEGEVWQMARKYSLNYDRFLGLAICESTLDPDAVGEAGEIGIYQFLQSTFSYYAEMYEKVGFSIHNTNHQIELAAQMISNGRESEWTCLY